MKIILCTDQNGGMLFNKRRQSRDREVIADIAGIVGNNKLYISPYSALLFENTDITTVISEDYLAQAKQNDYCFVETDNISHYTDNISELIIYRWNRIYPADKYIDIDPQSLNGKLSVAEFKGYSHEKITREIYTK